MLSIDELQLTSDVFMQWQEVITKKININKIIFKIFFLFSKTCDKFYNIKSLLIETLENF